VPDPSLKRGRQARASARGVNLTDEESAALLFERRLHVWPGLLGALWFRARVGDRGCGSKMLGNPAQQWHLRDRSPYFGGDILVAELMLAS
jgi:hypothetical protein